MVSNVPFDVLAPKNWMVVLRLEYVRDIFSPSFDGVQPVLAEDDMHMVLNCSDCFSGDMIAETAERCGGLSGEVRAWRESR